jgi:hypothetical protein
MRISLYSTILENRETGVKYVDCGKSIMDGDNANTTTGRFAVIFDDLMLDDELCCIVWGGQKLRQRKK